MHENVLRYLHFIWKYSQAAIELHVIVESLGDQKIPVQKYMMFYFVSIVNQFGNLRD